MIRVSHNEALGFKDGFTLDRSEVMLILEIAVGPLGYVELRPLPVGPALAVVFVAIELKRIALMKSWSSNG